MDSGRTLEVELTALLADWVLGVRGVNNDTEVFVLSTWADSIVTGQQGQSADGRGPGRTGAPFWVGTMGHSRGWTLGG